MKSTRPATQTEGWSKTAAEMTPAPRPDPWLDDGGGGASAAAGGEEEEDAMDLDAPAPGHVLMPLHGEQTLDALRGPRERAAVERLRRDPLTSIEEPLLAYVARQRLPTAAADAIGEASSMGATGLRRVPARSRRGRVDPGVGVALPTKKTIDTLSVLGGDSAQDGMLLGRPLPIDVQLAAASDYLRQSALAGAAALAAAAPLVAPAAAAGKGPLRMGTVDGGPVGNYKQWLSKPSPDDYRAAFTQYFANDKFAAGDALDLDVPVRGHDPSTHPALAALVREAARSLDEQREALEDATGDVPLPRLEVLNRDYFQPFRMPISPSEAASGRVRPCRRGEGACLFRIGSSEARGYVGREFLLPAEKALSAAALREARPRPGLCIDCLLASWSMRTEENRQGHVGDRRALNTFTVLCGRGEYGAHAMLEPGDTGIVGHVPRYAKSYREYVLIPPVYAARMGLSAGHYYCAEVNMDFL